MIFILGLIIFFGVHGLTAFARGARAGLLKRFGEAGYKGIYSLASLAGFALIVIGWSAAPTTPLYSPPYWLRHVAYLLVLLAFISLASAYLPAGRIKAALKHPMLAGVKLWAFGHLLANGDVRSVLLFGAFLAYAVADRIAVKRRGEPTPAAGPFRNDAIAVIVGVVGWFAVYMFLHPYIAGVALR
ncbi:MAG: NnrU family protein [Alphaproteobacteria bacterium]|nr:NnrU family protein [Alphaproteobacteria bacterium]